MSSCSAAKNVAARNLRHRESAGAGRPRETFRLADSPGRRRCRGQHARGTRLSSRPCNPRAVGRGGLLQGAQSARIGGDQYCAKSSFFWCPRRQVWQSFAADQCRRRESREFVSLKLLDSADAHGLYPRFHGHIEESFRFCWPQKVPEVLVRLDGVARRSA